MNARPRSSIDPTPAVVDAETLKQATETLCRIDRDLGKIVDRFGPPPLWGRPPGFATLVRIILEQQVSLLSARAMYRRVQQAVGRVSVDTMLRLDQGGLRRLGVTRQKALYICELATSVADRRLDLHALKGQSADSVRHSLMEVKGIGRWTADVYLLMALRRPDVWPTGDLALVQALRKAKRLRTDPDPGQQLRLAERWTPWRSVAARILWHDYLQSKRRRAP